MGDNFLGVELPQSFDSSNNTSTEAPASNVELQTEQQVSKPDSNTEITSAQKELLDLDKLDRFRFQGKEWSIKDLRNAYMMKQDYTRKTQEVSETRKYADNFATDLDAVLKNPELFDEMRRIYPAQFVQVAEQVLAKALAKQEASHSSPSANNALPPEVVNLQKELSGMKTILSDYQRERHQAEIAKNEAWIEKTYSSLSKKYPDAIEELVTARAAFIREQGHDINEQVLEKIFKDINHTMQEKYTKRAQAKVSGQLNSNLRGKDTGAGGGIPTSPAVKPKNLSEAKEAALRHFGAK